MKRPAEIPSTVADLPEYWAAWARWRAARWWWPPNQAYAAGLWAAAYQLRTMLREGRV